MTALQEVVEAFARGYWGTPVEEMEVGGRFRTLRTHDYRVITGISSRPGLEAVFLHWKAPNGDGLSQCWPRGTRLDYLPPADA